MRANECLWSVRCLLALLVAFAIPTPTPAQPRSRADASARLESISGQTNGVQVARRESEWWDPGYVGQALEPGDRVKTGPHTRAVVRYSDTREQPLGPDSLLLIQEGPARSITAKLLRGFGYLLSRERPGLFSIGTPAHNAIIKGTDVHVAVADDGTTTLLVLDGVVEVTNQFGSLELTNGQASVTKPNEPPRLSPALDAINVIQWCLYYPGVLDVDELEFEAAARDALRSSIEAYRAGDLSAALAAYPEARDPATDAEKIYRAALLLSVGRVSDAESLLAAARGTERAAQLATALQKLIAAVKRQSAPASSPSRATEWLAESYFEQAHARLEPALAAARRAVEVSPRFGFAWARLAELEFSFGRRDAALAAADKSLSLSPRNAAAVALKGFALAARNETVDALATFDQAIALDGALANAWLGRGLCRMRRGDTQGGLQDLQTAAALEPQRAVLRSYLGKGFSVAGNNVLAAKDLALAQRYDTNDPTAWLYSALVKQQDNRVNEAIRDAQRSVELNDNRALYRSRLLLDQDRAVRNVNLAQIYDDAGLRDVSVWEASRAVNADYANFSAHLFLADSFQRQRDLRSASVNQRYETAAVNEYLLATLLSPVGAGTLAHSVSQQEYSKLFERDGFGVASTTEYLSRGAWTQSGAQYGTFGNSSYAVSAFYQSDNGQQHNGDIEQMELSVQLQQQLTPDDTIYFRAIYGEAEGGDLAQYYDPTKSFIKGGPNTLVRFDETQEPILLAGYRHEWSPGVHTLALAGRLDDTFRVSDPQQVTLALERDLSGDITAASPITVAQRYRSEVEIYTAEFQQIWQGEKHTVVAGTRYQFGDFETRNRHIPPPPFAFPAPQRVDADFNRASVYAYEHWRVFDPVLLVGGVTYDWLKYPVNFRFAPLSRDEDTTSRVSPKAGFIWTPLKQTTVRFAYSQSLGGVAFDQSFRLEPVQVAGFNQAFRSLIPESVAGVSSAARFETWAASVEQKIAANTFIGVSGEILSSQAERVVGAYNADVATSTLKASGAREHLDFEERSVAFSASQLVGREWSFGVRYRLSRAELDDDFVDIAGGKSSAEALLHQLMLFAIFNHASGFFAEAQTTWHAQHSNGYSPALNDEDLWQLHAFAGYRFAQRRAELRVGVLNLTDQDYRLNPLNLISELPRERTFVASFRFYF